jgi:tetrahydromethanopterin S-methyltransferase subunit C
MTTPDSVSYRERLVPSWWVWLVALGIVTMVSVAYGAALGPLAGWLIAGMGSLVAVALVWGAAPVIRVDAHGLQAGRARLPTSAMGEVRSLDRSALEAFRGPGADARLFAVVRASSAAGGVLVLVRDDDDPHPAWLLSSRHPERMASALTATIDAPERP